MPIDMVGVTFEYEDAPKRRRLYPGEMCRFFVTVLDEFKHHYTDAMMYEIRVEWKEDIGGYSCAKRGYVSHYRMMDMWENRIKEGEN